MYIKEIVVFASEPVSGRSRATSCLVLVVFMLVCLESRLQYTILKSSMHVENYDVILTCYPDIIFSNCIYNGCRLVIKRCILIM